MEAELSNRLKSIHAYVRDLISCGHLSSEEERMMTNIKLMCLGGSEYKNGNLVEIAGDKLLPFVEAMKKIDQMAEYTSMGQRKPIPGFRFFECPDCENKWKEKTRDCHSPSCETCECGTDCHPVGWSEVRELPVDKSGNLI